MNNTFAKELTRKFRAVAVFSALIITFLGFLYASSIQCTWTDVERIIAVGDLHGDYGNFVKILKGTKLIDDRLHWIGGKTHLVQTGDVMDRGPDAKKIFDLLMKLEKEAKKTGGKVHPLIGNHEEMNIIGIAFNHASYVTVGQFVSFLPDRYRNKKEKEFRRIISEKTHEEDDSNLSMDMKLKKYWKDLIESDEESRKQYVTNFNKKYGNWILKHNVVIKINDIIFVHGGINEAYSTWKLEDINNLLRKELDIMRRLQQDPQQQEEPFEPQIVYSREGPLWYRDLAQQEERVFEPVVDIILQNLNANYIVIGHTIIKEKSLSVADRSRFQERIWLIDTGISGYYGGKLSALIIENSKFSLWGIDNEK